MKTEAELRKECPVFSGVLHYFPDLTREQLWSFIWGYDGLPSDYTVMDSEHHGNDPDFYALGRRYRATYILNKED